MADYRAGVLAALFRNAHRPKNASASEPSDFFASLREHGTQPLSAPRVQTPERMLEIFQMITGAEIIH